MVGGMTSSVTAMMHASVSIAPAAPSRWPVIDFVLEMLNAVAWRLEDLLDGLDLGDVPQRGRRAAVDVIELIRGHAGIVQRRAHHIAGAQPFRVRGRQVMCIGQRRRPSPRK